MLILGMADNVLKPLMLGRGVDAPMLVILLGALGGMAAAGIFGMFIGATLLALGYQIFMGWVHTDPGAGGAIRITSRQRTETHFARWAHMPVPSINRERGLEMTNLNNGFRVMAASMVAAAGLLAVGAPGFATEQAQQRREARDTKQDTRQGARETKADCRAADQKSNAGCRQDKREDKQEGRQQARDIKY